MTLTRVHRAGEGAPAPTATARLGYEARLLRRRRLALDDGGHAHVDLPETVSLDEGDVLSGGGAAVRILAAGEPLLRVTGPELARYAWHIGNRHAPCAIAPEALLIQADPVMADMLRHLGATVDEIEAPFRPEGGAYGHGRTLPHAHGPAESGHHHHTE